MINKQNIKKVISFLFTVLRSAKVILTIIFVILCLLFTSKYYIASVNFYGKIINKLNGYIFLSIATLSALISYPIFSFVCNFKTKQHKSINDILLLCIFFILLGIPASKIDKATHSATEDRKLATMANFFKQNNEINNNFGKDFEKWFNDRFFSRQILIYAYEKITQKINKNYNTNRVIINTKDKWFFFKREIKENYTIPNSEELDIIRNNLTVFTQFCNENNIKSYIVIIPNKSNIYREYIPFHNLDNQRTYGEVMFDYFNKGKNEDFVLLYPEKEFLEAKSQNTDRLFFSSDLHLTPFGGYIVYKAIMKEIKKDFEKLKIAELNDFDCVKSKTAFINVDENIIINEKTELDLGYENEVSIKDASFLDYEYQYFYPKKDSKIITTDYDHPYLAKSKTINPEGKYKILLLGTSFMEQPKVFFRYSFKNLDKVRINTAYEKNFHMTRFENYIKTEKPDVLVVLLNEFEAHQYIKSMYDETIELEP